MLALGEAGTALPEPRLDAFVLPIGDHMRDAAYEVLRSLREAGISADVDLVGRGPSKNLDFASAAGAKFAVLVGKKEWKSRSVAIKDLEKGDQRQVGLNELDSFVRARK